MKEQKTMRGYGPEGVIRLMITALENTAYKTHPTKSYLTTISSDYTRERLTKVFGPFGMGWGLTWDAKNTKQYMTKTDKDKDRYHFALLQADFWYKMGADIVSFPVTGYSVNDNLGDAMEGARTNAVSAGAKQLLFQIHVYKNAPYKSPMQDSSKDQPPPGPEPEPPPEPEPVEKIARPMLPAVVKEKLYEIEATLKVKGTKANATKFAPVVSALGHQLFNPPPVNGGDITEHAQKVKFADHQYRSTLRWLWDLEEGSAKNLTVPQLHAMCIWLTTQPLPTFKTPLVPEVKREAELLWEAIREDYPFRSK